MEIVALAGSASSNFVATSLKPSVINLNTMPTPRPQNTLAACRPPPSDATRTSAQASPSG
jgi:hypothetical protein